MSVQLSFIVLLITIFKNDGMTVMATYIYCALKYTCVFYLHFDFATYFLALH